MFSTREEWLVALMSEVAPLFVSLGKPLPDRIRVTCGFGSGGTRGRKLKQVGECWSDTRSGDQSFEIMVAPTVDDPVKVASILVHELCHAADRLQSGHRGEFARLARGLFLEGPLTATVAGPSFTSMIQPILDGLGAYPHARLDASMRTKQGIRMLKCVCPSCGYTVRTTAKWLAFGSPICPVDNLAMS